MAGLNHKTAFAASIAEKTKYGNNYQLEDLLVLARTAVDTNQPQQAGLLVLGDKAIKVHKPVKRKKKD